MDDKKAVVPASEKAKALAAALAQIEKQFGKGSVMRMDASMPIEEVQVVSTGSLGLDVALGVGGLPRGRVVEIFDRVLPDPEIAIVEDCMRVYREGGHDGLVGVGGGSAIDIAKSVAAYAGYHGALADLFGVDQVPRKGPPAPRDAGHDAPSRPGPGAPVPGPRAGNRRDRKSTRLNSSHNSPSRMPSSA